MPVSTTKLVRGKAAPSWSVDGTRVNSVILESRNGPLIAEAARLWIQPGDLVLDVTFGRGNFWTHYEPQFFLTHDLFKGDGVDFRALPEDDQSIDVLVLDPPYVSTGGRKTSTIPEFNDAYGLTAAPRTPHEATLLLLEGVFEAHRVLKAGGRLIVKCQDYISGGKFYKSHAYTVRAAEEYTGFTQVDEFIHASGPGPQPKLNLDGSTRRQVHSRRVHSFLLVFEKGKRV